MKNILKTSLLFMPFLLTSCVAMPGSHANGPKLDDSIFDLTGATEVSDVATRLQQELDSIKDIEITSIGVTYHETSSGDDNFKADIKSHTYYDATHCYYEEDGYRQGYDDSVTRSWIFKEYSEVVNDYTFKYACKHELKADNNDTTTDFHNGYFIDGNLTTKSIADYKGSLAARLRVKGEDQLKVLFSNATFGVFNAKIYEKGKYLIAVEENNGCDKRIQCFKEGIMLAMKETYGGQVFSTFYEINPKLKANTKELFKQPEFSEFDRLLIEQRFGLYNNA